MGLNEEGERWRLLKYVSLRLAKRYLDLLSATEVPGLLSNLGIDVKLFDVLSVGVKRGASPKELGLTNAVGIARALDVGLRGTYLDLSAVTDPGTVTKGQLVKATLLFQPAHMQIQNYDLVHPMREPYYVVGFSSIDQVPGIGRVFIGLVGSEHNLLSLPGDGTVGAGHTASHAEGLYEMIQYTKEKLYGEDINQRRLQDDLPRHYRDATEAQRLKVVASAFSGYAVQSAPRPTEVLFEVHYADRDVDLDAIAAHTDGAGHVDLAVFGAPLWVREATDRELLSISDIFMGAGGVDQQWDVFDEQLRQFIRSERYETKWHPRSEDEWRHFGRWAAAWAARVGPATTPLLWRPPRRRFLGLLRGGAAHDPTPSRVEGWLTHDWDIEGYVLSQNGLLYPVLVQLSDGFAVAPTPSQNDGVVYAGEAEIRPVTWNDEETGEAATTVLLSISRWLLPFADRRNARPPHQ